MVQNIFLLDKTENEQFYFFSNNIHWSILVEKLGLLNKILIHDIFIECNQGEEYKCFSIDSFVGNNDLKELYESIYLTCKNPFIFKMSIEILNKISLDVYDDFQMHLIFDDKFGNKEDIYLFIQILLKESLKEKSNVEISKMLQILEKNIGQFCEFDDDLNLVRMSNDQLT